MGMHNPPHPGETLREDVLPALGLTVTQAARELGINDLAGMCAVVMSLTTANFYKSMTTYADHRIWQDVYRAKTTGGDEVYLKLTVIDDVLIVSFKEL